MERAAPLSCNYADPISLAHQRVIQVQRGTLCEPVRVDEQLFAGKLFLLVCRSSAAYLFPQQRDRRGAVHAARTNCFSPRGVRTAASFSLEPSCVRLFDLWLVLAGERVYRS